MELTENILKRMSPADRKALGVQSAEEAQVKGVARSEKELSKQCVNLLRLRGIEVIVSRTDRKTSNNVGTPDLLFTVCGHDGYQNRVWACAVELKLPGYTMTREQREMAKRMTTPPNHFTHRVIHSVAELRMFLEGLGL